VGEVPATATNWRVPRPNQKRIEIFTRAGEFVSGQALTRAKSRLAVARARWLRTLENQIDAYRGQIEKLFCAAPGSRPLGSLPGAGRNSLPACWARSARIARAFEDVSGLQCLAGTAPVSYQSGKSTRSISGAKCNKPLRSTVHLWAEPQPAFLSVGGGLLRCAASARQEPRMRTALSGPTVAQNPMEDVAERHPVRSRTPYQNQIKHGSWVLKMQAA